MAIKPTPPGAGFAWSWHYGLRTLRKAYKSGRKTAAEEKAKIDEHVEEHQKLVDAGEATWSSDDDDGGWFDYGEHVGELIDEQESVLNHIRLAFLISLYHFVEQMIGRLLPRKPNGDPDSSLVKGITALKKYGWAPKEQELTALCLACNVAKHSEGPSAKKLKAIREGLFDAQKLKHGFAPGYESLKIGDKDLDAFFEAVRDSVPDHLGFAF